MIPQKIQGPGTALKFWGVLCWGKGHTVPEAVMDEVQAYPTPKNGKEAQVSVGFGVWRTCIPHPAQCLRPLYCLIKEGHVWDWGSEQQAAFEKARH